MTDVLIDRPELEGLGTYEFGWADSDVAGASARRGISPEVVADISRLKEEPEWMLQRRQRALQLFERKPMPTWGADLSEIDFIDSTGLGGLLELRSTLRSRSVTLEIVAGEGPVRQAVEITGLGELLAH